MRDIPNLRNDVPAEAESIRHPLDIRGIDFSNVDTYQQTYFLKLLGRIPASR